MHNFSINITLSPWCRMLLEKLIFNQLFKKYPAFYGNLRFITVLRKPATGTSPEPAESSSGHRSLSPQGPSKYYHPTYD
jgi:hypothetical protein